MKRLIVRPRAFVATSALCLLVAPYLHAQTVPASSSPSAAEGDEAIVLSPFIVDAGADENGYRANSTLAGTRVRTDLKDVASAISVVTQQFLLGQPSLRDPKVNVEEQIKRSGAGVTVKDFIYIATDQG